ncbi:hypothetical protein DVH24_000865 [Malus domestica]|uniref:Uncharacterized protein n=1 Tax=Malus domestica TaxID=3750 RepID=A0A498JZ71_MALDO|nr:hypothetical protein DVH24_000865 [Malus domestica]
MAKKKDTEKPVYACSDTIGYLKVMLLSKPKLNTLNHHTENYKAEQLGCKQETKFTFTEQYADEELGFYRRVPF